jgi:hypothetical protein
VITSPYATDMAASSKTRSRLRTVEVAEFDDADLNTFGKPSRPARTRL